MWMYLLPGWRGEMSKYQIPDNEEEGEVLKNKLELTDPLEIATQETQGFANAEYALINELTDQTSFDVEYICRIHRLALSKVYEFAGNYRTMNMSKEGFHFSAAHVLPRSMRTFEQGVLNELSDVYNSRNNLVRDIGVVHAELLYIHPFREGNGRAARILANMMAYKAGYPSINFDPIAKRGDYRNKYIRGVQQALDQEYTIMIELIEELLPAF